MPNKIKRNNKDKYLNGSDVILNLKTVDVHDIDSYSSLSCSGRVSFYFGDTKYGCVEDPDLTGKIKVLKSEKKKGRYILEVIFKRETDDS